AYIVGSELLNNSLKNAHVAGRQTGFPVLGILPVLFGKKKRQVQAAKRAEDILTRQLLLKMQQKVTREPFIIGVLSSLAEEGKSTAISILANQLNAKGIKTLALFPEDHVNQIASGTHTWFYSPLYGLNNRITLSDIIGQRYSNYTVILVEFPAVLEITYPTALLKYLDLIVLTVRANRAWQEADEAVFEEINNVTHAPIEILLNGVLAKYNETHPGSNLKKSKKVHQKQVTPLQISQPEEASVPV
ncbi:MAG: hypothetical protein M3142_03435, partial [Bacteroidota bacterium]|nr:hypothetical protein [Bacteroidota bacterium]